MEETENKKSTVKIFDEQFISILTTYLIAITVFDIMNVFFNLIILRSYITSSFSFAFSMLMSTIVFTFFMAIFRKAHISTGICYTIIYLLNLINHLKILFVGEPFYFSDIKFIGQIGSLFNLINKNISYGLALYYFAFFLIYAVILVRLFFLNKKYDITINSKKIRIPVIILDILIIVFLFTPNKNTKDLFLQTFFKNDEYLDYDSYTNNINYYLKVGMINGMYGSVLNNNFSEPDNYNENFLNATLDSVEDTSNNILGKPNIIVFFSESFFDVDKLSEVKFNKTVTNNFTNLQKEGKLIDVISPAYGGMSENVSFELLTGASMNYFPKGYIPIMSLYSRKTSSTRPSIVNVLKNNGYNSKIIFGKDYYSSCKTFSQIGFDEYIDFSETHKVEEVTDKFLVDHVIKQFENKNNKKPFLCVLETFEAHMPYTEDKYDNYDIEILESDLSAKENEALQAYSQAIHNSDKELKRLYDFINTYDEPTIILFLGDHLPYLYSNNHTNLIDVLKYFNTDDELLNYYRTYNTQCLILANFDTSNLDVPKYSGTDLIFPNLLNQMDIQNDKYYQWLNSTSDILSASNRYISLDKNGKMYYTNDLPENMKSIYTLKNHFQYNFFMK